MQIGDIWRTSCLGTCWRTAVGFFADTHLDPLLVEPEHEPCGRFIVCPRGVIPPVDYPIPPLPFIRRDEVGRAVGRAVLISESSAVYSPEQRRAVRIMATYLETTLDLPVIHQGHWLYEKDT